MTTKQLLKPKYEVTLQTKPYRHYEIEGYDKYLPGVTTVLGAAIAKPWLGFYSANKALENVERVLLQKLGEGEKARVTITLPWIKGLIEESKKKPDEFRDAAGDLGTLCHKYIDDWINGRKQDPPLKEVRPAISAFQVEVILLPQPP